MTEKTMKEKIRSAMEELGSQYETFRTYMRESKPQGVERERRMTPEMVRILNYSEDGCAYGLKSHWNPRELEKKLPYLHSFGPTLPGAIEIHLKAGDLENHRNEINDCLENLSKKQELHVSIHEPIPMRYKGMPLDLSTNKEVHLENTKECLQTLCDICEDNKVLGFVAHPSLHNPSKDNFQTLLKNLRNVENRIKDKMFLENVSNFHTSERIKDVYNLGYEICYDIAHGQVLLGTDSLIESVKELSPIVKYWHFSDVKGDKHGYVFCEGTVPWNDIIPFAEGIIITEVRNNDESDPFEMTSSLHAIRYSEYVGQTSKVRKAFEKHGVEISF